MGIFEIACVRIARFCGIRYRYVAYGVLLTVIYVEMLSRFGVPLAMIGGMVKEDCSDNSDPGSFCWSEDTKALVIGAFFYGYAIQFVITLVAKRLGFSRVYRFWMIISALVQISYPFMAEQSTTLLIISQALRGSLTGVLISYNMEFTRKWTIGTESKTLISFIGATNYVGNGSGALLGGLITTHLGWQYYFYISGGTFVLATVLHLALVQDSPEESWFMSTDEKMLYKKDTEPGTKSGELKNPCAEGHLSGSATEAVQETGKGCAKPHKDNTEGIQSLKNILGRGYLWAFCAYTVGYNFVYYNNFTTTPFYLNKVLQAGHELISSITLGLSFTIAVCTILFSRLFQWVDKHLPWLQCRMLFTLVPMLIQVVISIVIPSIDSIVGVVVVLACSAVASSTLFSGSVITLNYELDPTNSGMLLSIFNSFGQTAGFLGPLLMAKITHVTEPNREDYDDIYRKRWSYFFFAISGFGAFACVAVVLAYVFRPNEWVDRSKRDKVFHCSVIENPIPKESAGDSVQNSA